MRCSRGSSLRALPVATVFTLLLFFSNQALQAKDPPADACTMLSADQLAKALGQAFGSPMKTEAPAAFIGSPSGTDCTYKANGPARQLLFRIYVESSAAAAKVTFDKLSPYYAPNTPVAGNWDTAYLDSRHAIHELKGKVRYYLNLDPVGADTAKTEKQVKDLATMVAGQL